MGTSCGMFCGTGLFGEPARDSADYQLVNTEAISASHKAMPHKYFNNNIAISVVAHRLSACACMQS